MSTPEERRIEEEVGKTLQLFDNDPVLEENPFLATRILAAKEAHPGGWREMSGLRSSLRYAVMLLILAINILTAVHYIRGNSAQNLQDELVSELNEDFPMEQSQNVF